MNILIACEESQTVLKAFLSKGHNAFSCDLQNCTGGLPGRHIVGDCLPLINGNCNFQTENGDNHFMYGKWDLLIARPPCTYLTFAGNQCFSTKLFSYDYIAARLGERISAIDFFFKFVNADCDKIAIENPKGVMNTVFRKPDCIVHPYMFADGYDDEINYHTKATCFWLKNLPPLVPTNILISPNNGYTRDDAKSFNWTESLNSVSVARSKTFPGIALAMAEQWG